LGWGRKKLARLFSKVEEYRVAIEDNIGAVDDRWDLSIGIDRQVFGENCSTFRVSTGFGS
jgi:hypothetical protein